MRNSTLLFLVKKSNEEIVEVCLAMKKRGFGVGRYNGTGGKVKEGETIEGAVLREAKEEIGVEAKLKDKVAEITFHFPHKKEWDQIVHIYITDIWVGDVTESEEMKPEWFSVKNIPYETMWPDDIFWLPEVLKGKNIKADFVFEEGDIIKEKEVIIF